MSKHLTFHNTIDIVPSLVDLLHREGETFEASSGNSVGSTRKCTEMLGVSFDIYDWDDRDAMIDSLGLSREFVRLDFLDRISPKPVNPGRAIEADEVGVLSKFLHDGLLDYTYSERLCNQYQFIIDLLIEHPNTRQAYMSVWDKAIDINRLEKMRVPCSLGYHFFIRDNKLVMIYSMRSLEVTKCLGNDIFTASLMLQYIANQVGVDYGYIQFHIGSMHIFG